MKPVLYSFRRCPYAMRARLALLASGVPVALREVVLRDKPAEFLAASPSGTVPCLITGTGVVDESLDIMIWALDRHDPDGWLDMPDEGWELIARCDGPFKDALDRTKYATRFPDSDPEETRVTASRFPEFLNRQLDGYLYGRPTLADFAILPFIRQFAFIDKDRFDAEPWPDLQRWLNGFLESSAFAAVMPKYKQWQPGDVEPVFPPPA